MPDDAVRLNQLASLQYFDPAEVLRELRRVERNPAFAGLPSDALQLRTQRQRTWREGRIGALFGYAIGRCVVGASVSIALSEAEDYDFITRWQQGGEDHFCPVQEKEWPPEDRNPQLSLQDILARLARSSARSDTIALVQLNRRVELDLSALRVPKMGFRELWFIAAASVDQGEWSLFGDMLNGPRQFDFSYPD
jgi:hypothetical protein